MEESIKNSRCYRADTIFKAEAKWPWRYRSRSKVIICDTPSHAIDHYIPPTPTPRNEVRGGGGILDSPCLSVCLSVCPCVCPSVCPLTFRVRPVASTVQDGFFPYLVQMINSMRGCVAYDDLWPWPISSRSFGLDLENRVRSVEIRRSYDRLISTMGFPILLRHLYIELGPWRLCYYVHDLVHGLAFGVGLGKHCWLQDVGQNCVCNDTGELVLNDEDNLKLWVDHYDRLLNVEFEGPCNELPEVLQLPSPFQCVRDPDPQSTHQMKCSKAAGLSGIIAEVLKAAGKEGVELARQLTEAIFRFGVIRTDWNESINLNLSKATSDTLDRANYHGLKLTDQVMKQLEHLLDSYILEKVNSDEIVWLCAW